MLISPLQGVDPRPRITQQFGLNPAMYDQFGLKGHDGIDFGVRVGTPIFAPFDGVARLKDDGTAGYGMHIKIRCPEKGLECVLGHLNRSLIQDGQSVKLGDKIAMSGNSGFSTGAHLHFGIRRLVKSLGDVWDWKVADFDNGFKGYYDQLHHTLTWEGSLFVIEI